MYSCLIEGGSGSYKTNILRMNESTEIKFLGYAELKEILQNKTSQDRRSKVKVTGLPGDQVTLKRRQLRWLLEYPDETKTKI